VVGEVLYTECILISNPNCEHRDIVNLLTRRIEGFMVAKKFVMISYNIHNDLLESALKCTPGKKSPNITDLAQSDFKAVSCLVLKKEMNSKMDELHDLGATDILTFALSNTRM
jgi:ATP phosphoribosyltransferase